MNDSYLWNLNEDFVERFQKSDVLKKEYVPQRLNDTLFQATLQISFPQFLKTIRMIKAIELILKTRQPIGDIA